MSETLKGWKIWYGDGSTFTSRHGTWADAPIQDIQIVMLYFDKRDVMGNSLRSVFSGFDYYFKDGDNISAAMTPSETSGEIKYGKEMAVEAEFEKIRLIAMKDYFL